MNVNIILNALIHILILVLFFTFFINNKNDTNSVIFILVATVVFICYLLEFVRKPNPDISNNNTENYSNNLSLLQSKFNTLKQKINSKGNVNVQENFSASIDHTIGPYDGKNLTNNKSIHQLEENYEAEQCGWRKPPCDVKLLSNIGFVTPTGIEKKYERMDKPDADGNPYNLDLNLPSVSGDKNDPNAMFMFAYNQSSPDCCPSTFSTSTGCVCTTKKQREYINKRGGNRNKDIYPAI
jgi:hypothetical protein